MVHSHQYFWLIKVPKRPCPTNHSNKNNRLHKSPLHPLPRHNPHLRRPHQPSNPPSRPHSPLPSSIPILFRSPSPHSHRLHRKSRNRSPRSPTSLCKSFRHPPTTTRHPCNGC